jgi:RNA polymerase sigma-70 factor (ECF subfamily)
MEEWATDAANYSPKFDSEIRDGRLRLMFACCHPILSGEDQSALALKTLCAFSPAEIAKAFLTTEAAVAKRLTRAKQKIRDERIQFEIPAGKELSRRLDAVLQTLYLLFNEGYKASSGDDLVREELCREAIRQASLLAEHPAGKQPRTHALIALMLLNAARLRTRTDAEGNILLLKEQDRAAWDREMIARGVHHLSMSAVGDELTPYHLQAAIAACHCVAGDYESTDWEKILSLYDQLLELNDSPVIALNRAVAVANIRGPQAGIEAVRSISGGHQLDSYYLLYAVLGEFEAQLNHFSAAIRHFRTALKLTDLTSEQSFLAKRLRDCEGRSSRVMA